MNKSFLVAILVAVLVVAGGILLIWKLQPSMQEQQEQALAGAFREGTPNLTCSRAASSLKRTRKNLVVAGRHGRHHDEHRRTPAQ